MKIETVLHLAYSPDHRLVFFKYLGHFLAVKKLYTQNQNKDLLMYMLHLEVFKKLWLLVIVEYVHRRGRGMNNLSLIFKLFSFKYVGHFMLYIRCFTSQLCFIVYIQLPFDIGECYKIRIIVDIEWSWKKLYSSQFFFACVCRNEQVHKEFIKVYTANTLAKQTSSFRTACN